MFSSLHKNHSVQKAFLFWLILIGFNSTFGVLALGARSISASSISLISSYSVRVFGPGAPGSGTLVSRDENSHYILTAWHVVEGLSDNEEIDIETSDGIMHTTLGVNVNRIKQLDLAVIKVQMVKPYPVSNLASKFSDSSLASLAVAGFPLDNPNQITINDGDLVAYTNIGLDQGYELFYRIRTSSGMSGGGVFLPDGTLVGIHGRGDADQRRSIAFDKTTKTGVNIGIPLTHYLQFKGTPYTRKPSVDADEKASLLVAQSILAMREDTGYQLAIKLLSQIRDIATRQEPLELRAVANYVLGNYKESRADLFQIAKLDPNSYNNWSSIGLSYAAVGELQLARTALEKSFELIAMGIDKPKFNSQASAVVNNLGLVVDQLGDRAKASEYYSLAIEISPTNASAMANKGASLMNRRDYLKALSLFNRAIKLQPNYGNAYMNRGLLKDLLGDPDGAISDLNKAVQLTPVDPQVYLFRAQFHSRRGSKSQALADFDKVVALDPQNPARYFDRALFKQHINDLNGARIDLEVAISSEYRLADAFFERSVIHRRQGFDRRELLDLNRAIESDPMHAKALRNRAMISLAQNSYKRALSDLRSAIQSEPKNPVGHEKLGATYLEMNDRPRACSSFRQALNLYVIRQERTRELNRLIATVCL